MIINRTKVIKKIEPHQILILLTQCLEAALSSVFLLILRMLTSGWFNIKFPKYSNTLLK